MTSAFIGPVGFTSLRHSTFANSSLQLTTRRPSYHAAPARRLSVRCNEAETAAQPAATSPKPASTMSTPPAGKSTFRDRYEHLRGADIEPVSGAMLRFTNDFKRPVPIVYRAVVNETITTTHLARVCAMWRFDAVFAFGYDSIFSTFLRYYPSEDERDSLYKSVAGALKFDEAVLKEATASVTAWVEGKTEEDVFAALDAAAPGATTDTVGPVIEALVCIRDGGDADWYYSRLFGLGLIQVMAAVGTELTIANAEKWADRIGLEKSKMSAEMGNYLSGMERLKQAEQIFAEATAREAKKTAERLAVKAKKAAEEAEKLEKGPEAVATEVAPETSPEPESSP